MKTYWFFLWVFFPALVFAKAPLGQVFFSLENTFAHVKGFSQIPKGGKVGSSSFERPSFEEVGVHHDSVHSMEVGIQYNNYYVALQYQPIHLQGGAPLQTDLITHAQQIPAGRDFSASIRDDWYRLEIGRKFYAHSWQFTPFLQANVIKYDYHFFAWPQMSRRTFSFGGVTVGGDVQFYMTKRFAGEMKAAVTLPLFRLKIRTAQLGIRYDMKIARHLFLTPTCGLGVTYFDYQDKQTLPNHIRYQGWPEIKVGFVVAIKED